MLLRICFSSREKEFHAITPPKKWKLSYYIGYKYPNLTQVDLETLCPKISPDSGEDMNKTWIAHLINSLPALTIIIWVTSKRVQRAHTTFRVDLASESPGKNDGLMACTSRCRWAMSLRTLLHLLSLQDRPLGNPCMHTVASSRFTTSWVPLHHRRHCISPHALLSSSTTCQN